MLLEQCVLFLCFPSIKLDTFCYKGLNFESLTKKKKCGKRSCLSEKIV